MGLTSNSASATPGPYSATGCTGKIADAGNAVDSSRTNYATFSSLLAVNCNPQLQVGLTGTAPGSYRAGFVIGQGNTLLDASVLGGLTLRTYKDGVLQETAFRGLAAGPERAARQQVAGELSGHDALRCRFD